MRPALLALVVLLAGCSGGFAADPTPSTTVTPAPLPATTPTAAPNGYPPGMDAGGVTDAARVAHAHAETLDGRSFTVTRVEVRRDPDGTLRERYERTVHVAADPYRFAYRLVSFDADTTPVNRTDERWSGGTRAFASVTRGDERTVSETSVRLLPENATNEQGLARLFSLLDARLVGEEIRNGTRLYRVAAGPGASVPPSISDASLEAVIDARGVVRAYDLSYAIDRGDDRLRVEVRVRFTAVGSTTVPRPEWVPDEGGETSDTPGTGVTDEPRERWFRRFAR
jgi:hypothetical protein